MWQQRKPSQKLKQLMKARRKNSRKLWDPMEMASDLVHTQATRCKPGQEDNHD
jgi:hypothetical protein